MYPVSNVIVKDEPSVKHAQNAAIPLPLADRPAEEILRDAQDSLASFFIVPYLSGPR